MLKQLIKKMFGETNIAVINYKKKMFISQKCTRIVGQKDKFLIRADCSQKAIKTFLNKIYLLKSDSKINIAKVNIFGGKEVVGTKEKPFIKPATTKFK